MCVDKDAIGFADSRARFFIMREELLFCARRVCRSFSPVPSTPNSSRALASSQDSGTQLLRLFLCAPLSHLVSFSSVIPFRVGFFRILCRVSASDER